MILGGGVVRGEELVRLEGEEVPHRQWIGTRPCLEGTSDVAETE